MNGAKLFSQISAFLRGLSVRQRALLGVTAVIVAATLWVFVRLIGKAEYKTLYSGLTPAEAQSMAQRLAAKNVPYELSADGASVRVPSSEIDRTRLEMASQGLPQSGRLGFELFDKPNWAGSDFAEKVNYQRALEGELERTVQTISQVEAVRVHLVLPRDSLFTEREREAKASVVLKMRGGRVPGDIHAAITHLVASAVDHLRAENVTIVSADGQLPLPARSVLGTSRFASEVEKALSEKLVTTLAPVVGAERVKASVAVEFDLATSENTQEAYDPNTVAVVSSQKAEERVSGGGVAGIPGTASNLPGASLAGGATAQSNAATPGAAAGAAAAATPGAAAATPGAAKAPAGEEVQGHRTESQTFAVSRTVRHTLQPPGSIKRIAAAVLLDDGVGVTVQNGQKVETRRRRTPEEMKQLEQLAIAAIGLDTAGGDRLSLQNLSFQSTPVEMPAAPTRLERVLGLAERWVALWRYLALAALFGVVYGLLLRPMKKQVLATLRVLPAQLAPGRVAGALPAGATPAALPAQPESIENEALLEQELKETNSEMKRAVMLKRHLADKVKREPANASRLIQSWIRHSEAGQ